MKTRKKLLSLLLTVVMVLTLLPTSALAAYEDGVDCEFCGSYRYDDWLCDNGDHCGSGASGNCYEEHHCSGCEACLEEGTEKCGNCEAKCGNCATVCGECSNCEDCVEAFCETCAKCDGCVGRICPNCDNCAECGAMGVDFYCSGCGNCAGCIDGNFCFDCELCYNCTQTCQAEGEGDHNHCEGCVDLCPECHTCSESWILPGVSCSDCGKCATCFEGAMCSDCGACSECVQLCAAEGEDHAHCENCVELCEQCHICSDGWILPGVKCEGCDMCAACFTGGLCTVCNYCEGCGPGDFCEASQGGDELHCSDCAPLCVECHTCAECSGANSLCPDCGTCSQCSPMYCDGCERCDNCATICDTCGEHCDGCSSLCQDCGNCAECNPLCDACGEYCGECKTTCNGCNTCEDCAKVCMDCGDFCSECDTMCTECEERCAQCTDTCEDCGVCAECATLCSISQDYCTESVPCCKNCNGCENCTVLCSKNQDRCRSCTSKDEFCSGCGACSDCATLCGDCGEFCSSCSAECEHCGGLTDCEHHAMCSVCNVCLSDPDHEVCGSCGSHLTDCYYESLDETVHQYKCSCGEPLEEPEVHWMLYKVITAPTETATGVGQRTCAHCEYAEEEIVIPATGEGAHVHDYSVWIMAPHRHVKACLCGEKDAATNEPHTLVWVTDQEPTGTQAGLKHESCTVCGHNRPAVSIPPIGHSHSYASLWSKDRDRHWKACGCGEKTEVAAHSFGPWVIITAPTETSAGSKERPCTVCAYKQVVVVPATAALLTVTFDSKGGSAVANQSLKAGSVIVKPAEPTKPGYVFVGWYTDSAYSSKWNFGNPIFEPKQLYAKWTVNLEGPPTIITEALSGGIKGVSYEEALVATGSAPFTYTLDTGFLPDGLSLSADGKITGTPTTDGIFPFTVKVSNGQSPDATKAFSIRIEVKHLVTVNGGTGGGYYSPGDTVTLVAGTKPGYTFKGWTSSDVTIADPSGKTISFTMPDKAVAVTANWRYNGGGSGGGSSYDYYTITASAGANGTISPSGSVSVREDLDKTFTITADNGYVVDDVLVDGKSVGSVKSYTFENIRRSHTIKATFVKAGQVNPQTGVDLPFEDVKESDWFYESVKYVFDKGLMAGTGDTTFAPNITTTRGMIVTVLHRMDGSPAVTGANPFDDVAEGKWYAVTVKWAAENKIVGGYGDGRFGPEDSITREQLAAILMNYAKHKGYDVGGKADLSKFSDADKISDWATAPLAWANAKGLVSGTGGGVLDPKGEATRAQVAAILMRFCESYK